jgi:hypothetical protein
MPPEPILAETIAGVHRILGDDVDDSVADRAVIGVFFTGVKLEALPDQRGRNGVAHALHVHPMCSTALPETCCLRSPHEW